MTIGDRIKDIREKRGFSQVDFADKIGVSKQTLYKYENNIITNIPSDKIENIATLTHVSPAYIMGWEESVSPIKARIELSPEEERIIRAYRAADDGIRDAVAKLLDVSRGKGDESSARAM